MKLSQYTHIDMVDTHIKFTVKATTTRNYFSVVVLLGVCAIVVLQGKAISELVFPYCCAVDSVFLQLLSSVFLLFLYTIQYM